MVSAEDSRRTAWSRSLDRLLFSIASVRGEGCCVSGMQGGTGGKAPDLGEQNPELGRQILAPEIEPAGFRGHR